MRGFEFAQLCGHKCLPDRAEPRARSNRPGVHPEQEAQEARVTEVKLGRLDDPFANVSEVWLEQLDLIGSLEDAQPLIDGLRGHANAARQVRLVHELTVV